MGELAIQLPAHEDQTAFNLERWAEILDDPFYAQLEQRIETDRHGHIIMTPPPSFSHGRNGFNLAKLLERHLPEGEASMEVPISTSDGVRAADVAWLSNEQVKRAGEAKVLTEAPAICVEVLSPGNTRKEMAEKMALYFDAGAQEVWLCNADGKLEFYAPPGEPISHSVLAADFPDSI